MAVASQRGRTPVGSIGAGAACVAACLVLAALASTGTHAAQEGPASSGGGKQRHHQPADQQRVALEGELNALLRQHGPLEPNNRQLAEAIIARLMIDNLAAAGDELANEQQQSAAEASQQAADEELPLSAAPSGSLPDDTGAPSGEQDGEPAQLAQPNLSLMLAAEPGRFRKLLALTRVEPPAGRALDLLPVLPAGQLATMKRAAARMAGQYLQGAPIRQLTAVGPPSSSYARNTFDFGLGKRPESQAPRPSVLRFGDTAQVLGQPSAPQFGKRPAGHRFDFGLGKRVANPAYPRYDFGLGKRVPNRIRYDFGLGK